jgi:hypothetical protein
MDGPRGEEHPILGARIMARLFGPEWGEFCLLHSRYFARRLCKQYSRLCCADKLAICLTPWWVYLPMVRLSGELSEYMNQTKYGDRPRSTPRVWFSAVQAAMRHWVNEHKDLKAEAFNGFSPVDASMSKLPGYLEGGYEPDRYRVMKRDGTISHDAKYLVLRYDGDRDPHTIYAALMYAASVRAENLELADGIVDAVVAELGLDGPAFVVRYGPAMHCMEMIVATMGPRTPEGIAFGLEMGREPQLPNN